MLNLSFPVLSVIGKIAKFLLSIGLEGLKREITRSLNDVRLQGPSFIYIISLPVNDIQTVSSGVTGVLVSQRNRCISVRLGLDSAKAKKLKCNRLLI